MVQDMPYAPLMVINSQGQHMMQVWGPCHDHGNMNEHSNGIQKVLFERNFESKIYNFTYWIRGGQSMERDVRLLDVSGSREQR